MMPIFLLIDSSPVFPTLGTVRLFCTNRLCVSMFMRMLRRSWFCNNMWLIRNMLQFDTSRCSTVVFFGVDHQNWQDFFDLSSVCICIFIVSTVGILLEERMAVRLILLFEICTASVIGYSVSIVPVVGTASVVVAILFLIVAAVESILLFGFIVLLHYLCQASDLSRFSHLQS